MAKNENTSALIAYTTPKTGERQRVVARFPTALDHAQVIAAFVEAAAVDEGIEYPEMLKRVAEAAPPVLDIRRVPCPDKRGAKPFDWEDEYCRPAYFLGLWATIQRVTNGGTWANALRQALIAARKDAKRRARSDATIKREGEALRQVLHPRNAPPSGWRRNPTIDTWGNISDA